MGEIRSIQLTEKDLDRFQLFLVAIGNLDFDLNLRNLDVSERTIQGTLKSRADLIRGQSFEGEGNSGSRQLPG